MENIYDIRKKENLLYILPKDIVKNQVSDYVMQETMVAVNLYYEDSVSRYMEYLNRIHKLIDVYIVSSNPVILEITEKLKKRPIKTLLKENRGRDVSALLVVLREVISEYEYVCFTHDKKSKQEYFSADVQIWISNMWDNLIGSENYIRNVLELLENNREIGMLAPPEPMGEFISAWYGDAWCGDYENCKLLAEQLKLCCDIKENKQPITLSTAFWARTKALKKLFMKAWCYTDFPEEPMADDGTISHAIERILGYVVQDAGYKVATAMTEKYAAWNLLEAQDGMRKMMKTLNQKLLIQDIHDANALIEKKEIFQEFFLKNKKVYLYGAGKIGKRLLAWCNDWKLSVAGFVISDNQELSVVAEGVNVYKLNELTLSDETGIIIAVTPKFVKEIEEDLKKKNFSNYIYGY